MTSSLRITTRAEDLGKGVFMDWVKYINADIKKALPKITEAIQRQVQIEILQDPTTDALLSDSVLKGFLGVDDTATLVDQVITAVTKSIIVRFKPFRVRSVATAIGGLEIGVLREDLKDVLAVPMAKYATENGDVIPVLEMLLLNGDRIYSTSFLWQGNRQLSGSRTGHALMIDTQGKSYWIGRVPPEHSGTIKSNWLTRAIDNEGFYEFIENLIMKYLI